MYMYKVYVQCKYMSIYKVYIHRPIIVLCIHSHVFFSIWVFVHTQSRFTGQQGKGKGIYFTPLYHFHTFHRHLDISHLLAAEGSPLHIASSWTRARNLWSPSASHWPLSYALMYEWIVVIMDIYSSEIFIAGEAW